MPILLFRVNSIPLIHVELVPPLHIVPIFLLHVVPVPLLHIEPVLLLHVEPVVPLCVKLVPCKHRSQLGTVLLLLYRLCFHGELGIAPEPVLQAFDHYHQNCIVGDPSCIWLSWTQGLGPP